jgi:hypothetical protein
MLSRLLRFRFTLAARICQDCRSLRGLRVWKYNGVRACVSHTICDRCYQVRYGELPKKAA